MYLLFLWLTCGVPLTFAKAKCLTIDCQICFAQQSRDAKQLQKILRRKQKRNAKFTLKDREYDVLASIFNSANRLVVDEQSHTCLQNTIRGLMIQANSQATGRSMVVPLQEQIDYQQAARYVKPYVPPKRPSVEEPVQKPVIRPPEVQTTCGCVGSDRHTPLGFVPFFLLWFYRRS